MAKNKKRSDPVLLSARRDQGMQRVEQEKLSEIIKEMAIRLLKNPDAIPSEPTAALALLLASAAWNSAVGDNGMREQHRRFLENIDWGGAAPGAEMRSDETDKLISELAAHKIARYPADLRRIIATELSSDGNVRVHWTEPRKIVTAAFPPAGGSPAELAVEHSHSIGDELVKKMRRYARERVVDLGAVISGKKNAEELQKTVATREDLADFHPAHAAYIYAQNQVSVMSEQLTSLAEMDPFAKLVSKAEDDYLPGGPPMSPLTTSFFTCWAFFDAFAGLADETIGTVVMAVGSAFGMHEDLIRLIGLMQESRMGIHVHEGVEKNSVVLRELVTDQVCRAISPSGYRGRTGELWYARVLPPPWPGLGEHVVFGTPYILLKPGAHDWQAYFRRTLPDAPKQARLDAYERHMKFGPSRTFWNEFVFEAYVNHQSDAIFLAGLPDVPASRPHSPVNS